MIKQRHEAEENDAKRRAQNQTLPYLDLISSKTPTELQAMILVPEEEAKKALLVPLQIVGKKLLLAVFDPQKADAKEIIDKLRKKFEVSLFVSSLTSLKHAWDYYQYVQSSKEITGKIEINEENLKNLILTTKTLSDLNSTIKNFKSPYTSQILEIILGGALALNASDIHLEPGETLNTIRLRIDGILHNANQELQKLFYQSLVSRVKLLSGLKLNIHDQAQDGRFTIDLMDRDIEIRTSVIPSEYGETVVMRILDPKSLKVNLEELGWRADDLEIVKKEITKPNGLILNTGPTGSGKTTTLYAFLRHISSSEIKIITIEDPIEYHLDGVSQTQVDTDADYTFASGLRSILRQDPDVILVGEIRDQETAEIAMNASLTGHLVLSTLHTNDAVGAIPRLIDLGAKPQILGPAISLVIAQRLVRLLCSDCKTPIKIDEKIKIGIKKFLENLPPRANKDAYAESKIYEPKGCPKCGEIGYRGRTSIFELFVVNDKIEESIYKNPTELDLKTLAREQSMVTMQEDGILKIIQGLTTFEEVERLTGPIAWLH